MRATDEREVSKVLNNEPQVFGVEVLAWAIGR
jgi:hypothetical protein